MSIEDGELPSEGKIRAWKKTESRRGEDLILFSPRFDTVVHPVSGKSYRRVVLEASCWVNVVARTPDQEIVFVRQYRFGTESITLEIPGGVVDDGEDHGAAARRELREETGYTAERWHYLGCVEPNPAVQDNLCHHWLAEGAIQSHRQELDGGEDIEILRFSAEQVRSLVRSGEVRHSLVLTALSRVLDLRAGGDR